MNKPFIDFTGQTCLITGAGSPTGIGFSVARILGETGGRIALIATTDRIYQRAEELVSMGIEARGYIADLMDRAQVAAVVKQIADDFGGIDVLVNNAGMAQVGEEEDFSDIMHVSYESWDTSINRNLNICFNVTKQVLPYMVGKKYGRIVNVSSVTGHGCQQSGRSSLQRCQGRYHRNEPGTCYRDRRVWRNGEQCPAGLDRNGVTDRERSGRRSQYADEEKCRCGRGGKRYSFPCIRQGFVYHGRITGGGRRQYHPGIQGAVGAVLLKITVRGRWMRTVYQPPAYPVCNQGGIDVFSKR